AVRDRQSDSWLERHVAKGHRLEGTVRVLANGEAIPQNGGPQLGEALYFTSGERELVTSLLCEVARPSRSTIQEYS
ncbi:MAG: hypothetical protein MK135_13035, partial [Polyangiaceae bacterium]|nr:hypothetical protein [Polyangiaceae bacterium]